MAYFEYAPERFAIARPDDELAGTALAHHPSRYSMNGWGAVVALLGFTGIVLTCGLAGNVDAIWPIFIVLGLVFMTGLGGIVAVEAPASRSRPYRHLLKTDRIIELDPDLVIIWDTMRSESGLALSNDQRAKHLAELFDPAIQLRPVMDEYRALAASPGRRVDLDYALARIRATLRPYLQLLGATHEAASELTAQMPKVITAGPTEEAIQEELRLIKHQQS